MYCWMCWTLFEQYINNASRLIIIRLYTHTVLKTLCLSQTVQYVSICCLTQMNKWQCKYANMHMLHIHYGRILDGVALHSFNVFMSCHTFSLLSVKLQFCIPYRPLAYRPPCYSEHNSLNRSSSNNLS